MYREQREWGEVLVLRRREERVFRQRCLCAGQMISREYATVLSVAERKIAVVDTEQVFCNFLVLGGEKGQFWEIFLKYFSGLFRRFSTLSNPLFTGVARLKSLPVLEWIFARLKPLLDKEMAQNLKIEAPQNPIPVWVLANSLGFCPISTQEKHVNQLNIFSSKVCSKFFSF